MQHMGVLPIDSMRRRTKHGFAHSLASHLSINSPLWGVGALIFFAMTFINLKIQLKLVHAPIEHSPVGLAPQPADNPQQLRVNRTALTPEIWAAGPSAVGQREVELRRLLGDPTTEALTNLCGRCLYRTLTHYTRVKFMGSMTIVLTGDIPAMWLRDSAVQIATYLPRIKQRPALRCAWTGVAAFLRAYL